MRSVRRWGLLILVGSLVSGATALAVSRVIPPEYVATAELYIAPASNPTVAFQDVVLGTNVARSYVQLIAAEVVLRPAMEKTGWTDLRNFSDRVNAAQVPNTSIITVSFRDQDPNRAADVANAIAQSFIAQTQALQTSLQGTTVAQLETQINSVGSDISLLDQQISALRAEIAATPRPGQSASSKTDLQLQMTQLDAARQSKQQTLAQLLKTRDDMNLSSVRAQSTVSMWQPATAPDQPVSPRVALNTGLGLVSGALLTLLAVLVIGYFDDRLSDFDDVQARLGIPPLGLVNQSGQPDSIKGKLFVKDQPRSPEAEAFRSLRTNIQLASIDRPPRRLLVTSALPREGKSVVCANLAYAFAHAGVPTVLLDADLRRPSQHRIFGVPAMTGLTSLLTDPTLTMDLAKFEVMPHLVVIPSGPLPPNPAELLSSARMTKLVDDLGKRWPEGVIIIDTSPVLAATDAVALSRKVDGVLFVVDSARTNARASKRAVDALQRVRANVLGAVLNKISSRQSSYYYYNYYGNAPAPSAGRATPQRRI